MKKARCKSIQHNIPSPVKEDPGTTAGNAETVKNLNTGTIF